jgi:uncharacterized protein (TIGR02271 family)
MVSHNSSLPPPLDYTPQTQRSDTMNEEIIVAVYDTEAHAAAAVRDLEAAHVPPKAIGRHAGADSVPGSAVSDANSGGGQGFWSSLFGGEPDHDTAVYDRSLESGSSVVTVRVPDEHVDAVTRILERHQPIDIDERAASLGLGANRTPAAGADTQRSRETTVPNGGEGVIALSEEQLTVGKRLVNRGTTHIRRFVVETPVEENVTLHSERVSIDRRPASAGARVDNADFTDRTIEVAETDEEAVVSKTARVKEEVVVHKEATDRVETVRDTVRRQDVKIDRDDNPTSGATPMPATTADPKI